ncbi:hypothetical protein [Winogradskyella sp.]|uniref:hypothetical protein n=1 Tax=Winogradskyella sp. TaxID=1883156 RepID=UPI002628D814|nr:hypothetical protein [Winogradskyella sp.]
MLKSKGVSFIFLIFLFVFGHGQDIKGEWMQVKIPNHINYPPISIVELKIDSIFSYNFNELIKKGKLEIKGNNSIVLNDSVTFEFRFIGNNIFEEKINNPVGQKNDAFRYVRLLPTKDKNNLVESLKNKIYQISLPDEKVTFELGKKMHADNAIIISNPPIAANYTSIEKFKNTYFLCFYAVKHRTYAFPIKEINENYFSIYGIPKEENELIVERID